MIRAREKYIDIGAGIMITWMVFYHAYIYWQGLYGEYIPETMSPCVTFPFLCFFMPWFFYKSGRFFAKRPFCEHIAKDSRKLLIPFVIWSAVGYVFFLGIRELEGTLTFHNATYSVVRTAFLTGAVPVNNPLWFLLSLFGARLLANGLLPSKDHHFKLMRCFCIIIVTSAIAYGCNMYNGRLLPLWVANTSSGLCFFTLGYLLERYENTIWLISIGVVGYVICCINGFVVVDMMFNTLLLGKYLLWVPTCVCGIIVFNFVCRSLAIVETKLNIPSPLAWIGQHAMWIYVTHILLIETIFTLIRIYK